MRVERRVRFFSSLHIYEKYLINSNSSILPAPPFDRCRSHAEIVAGEPPRGDAPADGRASALPTEGGAVPDANALPQSPSARRVPAAEAGSRGGGTGGGWGRG